MNIDTGNLSDVEKCLSDIWYCTVQLLDDVGLEAVIFLESYNFKKVGRILSIKSTDVYDSLDLNDGIEAFKIATLINDTHIMTYM